MAKVARISKDKRNPGAKNIIRTREVNRGGKSGQIEIKSRPDGSAAAN